MTLSQSINWRGRLTEFTQKSDLKPPQVIEIRSRGWPGTFSFVCELAWGNKILRTCGTAMKKKFAKREAARLMCCRVADLTDDLLQNPMRNPHNPNDEGYWGPFYPYLARSRIPSNLDERSAPELTPPRCPSINKRNFPPPTRRTKPTIDRIHRDRDRDRERELKREPRRDFISEVHREVYTKLPMEVVPLPLPPPPVIKKAPEIEYKSFSQSSEPSFEDLLRLHKPDIELNKKEKTSSSQDIYGSYLKSLDKIKPGASSSDGEVQRSHKRRRSFSRSPKPRKLKHSTKSEKNSKKKKRKKNKDKKKRSKKSKKRKTESKHSNDSGYNTPTKMAGKERNPIVLFSENRPSLEPPSDVNVEAPKIYSMPPLEPDSPIKKEKITIILDDDDDDDIQIIENHNLNTSKKTQKGSDLLPLTSPPQEEHQDGIKNEEEVLLEVPCPKISDPLLDWTSTPPPNTSELTCNELADEALAEGKAEILIPSLEIGSPDKNEKSKSTAPVVKDKNDSHVINPNQTPVSVKDDQIISSDKAPTIVSPAIPSAEARTLKYKPEPKVIQQSYSAERTERNGTSKKCSPSILKTSRISASGKANLAVRICSDVKKMNIPNLLKIPKKSTRAQNISFTSVKPTSRVTFDPMSLLKSSPNRSCFRKPGDQPTGGRVRFKVGNMITAQRPDYLPVINEKESHTNMSPKKNKRKRLRFAEDIATEIIPRIEPPAEFPSKNAQSSTNECQSSQPVDSSSKPFNGKYRSPPPKITSNSSDVNPLIKDLTSNCGAEPMDLDDKETADIPVQRAPLAPSVIAAKRKSLLPNVVNQKSIPPAPFPRPRRSRKLFELSPRRSLRLVKLRSKAEVGKRTPSVGASEGDSDLTVDDAPHVLSDKVSASTSEIKNSSVENSSVECTIPQKKKNAKETCTSPARRPLLKKRVVKRKPGGKGSRKKKVEKRKTTSKS